MASDLFMLSETEAKEIIAAPYEKEHELQEIIADNPRLIIRQSDPEDLDILLVRREQAVEAPETATTRFVDHLMIGTDAVPILVEAKLRSNGQIYKEVVGQMLDYAAHISSTSIQSVRAGVASNNPENIVEEIDNDEFWGMVSDNFQNEKMKLVFVADDFPTSLKVLIEFIDRKIPSIDVYGIELRKHISDGKVFLNRTYIESSQKAAHRAYQKETFEWTSDKLHERVQETSTPEVDQAIREIEKYCAEIGIDTQYGKGLKTGSFIASLGNNGILKIQAPESEPPRMAINIPRTTRATEGKVDDSFIKDTFFKLPDVTGLVEVSLKGDVLSSVELFTRTDAMETLKLFLGHVVECYTP